jgi:3-hydroxyacyl-CoA dehydrogenase/enoyl-CoA hydratase/3-hydroxybutyryl-CoA epimerase
MSGLMDYRVDQDLIGHIVFDHPTEKMNVISAQFMEELLNCLDRIGKDEKVRGVVLESKKPGVFVAGADIKWLLDLKTAEDCRNFAKMAHVPFDRLEALKVPTVAAISGVCLGGGLEIALACRWRVAVDTPAVQIGLPEVKLGVIPGGGGTQRLPALVGIRSALELATAGKTLRAQEALKLGLVDAVFPAEHFNEKAKEFLLQKIGEQAAVARPWLSGDFRYGASAEEKNPEFQKQLFAGARQMTMKATKGFVPAPFKVIDSMEAGATGGFKAGLRAEQEIFGNILCSNEARNLIDLFMMQNAMTKVYGSKDRSIKPEPIKKVGVLGAGLMGSGIAHSVIMSGRRVVMKDVSDEALERGVNTIRGILKAEVDKGRMAEAKMNEALSRITKTTDYAAFSDVDLVIEAVFEDMGVKQQVIRDIEKVLPERAVFASNTSSLAISDLSKASLRPERFIGMHYFSPVNRMPLLEIIRGQKTSEQTVVTAVALSHATRKLPIVVNDCYGFYTTRAVCAYLAEALHCLNDGADIQAIDEALMGFGMPVGPITLLDEVGHDVGAHVLKIMQMAYPSRFSNIDDLAKLTVKDQRLGRKNQKGFYLYEGGKKKGVDESAYKLFKNRKALPLSKEEIQDRVVLCLINEVGFCMGENILTNPIDAEMGLIFGIGFPPFRGGPLHYIDQRGVGKVVQGLESFQKKWGDRFKPAPYLVQAAKENRKLFTW